MKIPAILSNMNLFSLQKVIHQCSVGSSETSWESNLRVKTM